MSNRKISWKKLLLTIIWMAVGTGTIVVLIAAAQNQRGKHCKDVIVTIKGIDGTEYVSKKQILKTISGGRPELMKGQLIRTFDLQQLEELLETNLWIRNAELFFDNTDVLHVDITEREPVARVFKVSGASFYVDELGDQLPITNEQVARVPVFTSFPDETTGARTKDSMLQQQVKEMGHFILKHDFWMAQVDQLNINNYEFELVPKLGNHVILFGDGTGIEPKFTRLLLFYQQIMNKTGWNYYSALDVRYNKQLIAVRRDSVSLFKSFVLQPDQLQINTAIDSNAISRDSSLSTGKLNSTDSSKSLFTSGTPKSAQKPESVLESSPVKPQKSQNLNALKNHFPTPEKKANIQKPKTQMKTEEEKVLSEVKKQPVKKEPKAVMKKKDN
jgi:cell division protein FtsQ